MATRTPWGQSQGKEQVTKGIIFYDTAGHGGYHLSKKVNELMPKELKLDNGWYEEDCDYARVVLGYAQHFDVLQVERAWESLRNWDWRAYEAYTHTIVNPEDSYCKKEDLRKELNKKLFTVSAALNQYSFVKVWGKRAYDNVEKLFMVPKHEYKPSMILDSYPTYQEA